MNVLCRVYDERLKLTPGATRLLESARIQGIHTLLVSGGFTYFTDRLRRQLRIDSAFANELVSEDGRLTGAVLEPIFDSAAKAESVDSLLAATDSTSSQAIVIGDGANDVPMLAKVEYSISYHGKPAARAVSRLHVEYGDLSVVLDYFDDTTIGATSY